jgi:hypothetical protein
MLGIPVPDDDRNRAVNCTDAIPHPVNNKNPEIVNMPCRVSHK